MPKTRETTHPFTNAEQLKQTTHTRITSKSLVSFTFDFDYNRILSAATLWKALGMTESKESAGAMYSPEQLEGLSKILTGQDCGPLEFSPAKPATPKQFRHGLNSPRGVLDLGSPEINVFTPPASVSGSGFDFWPHAALATLQVRLQRQ